MQFKHVELIATYGRQILLVVVLSGGEVRQQLLTLAEPVSQDTLSETAKRLNAQLVNLDAAGIRSAANRYPTFDQEIARVIADSLSREHTTGARSEMVLEGMSNVLAEPEFADTYTARQTQKILGEKTFLQSFLAKVLTSNVGSVQVIIGGEGDWEELKDCSMVLARYGINDVATGALGVVGPTRMAYGRAISTVRYVAELMTDLVNEAYGDN
jgi:heat-inducible transcriptional repressor